MDAETHLETAIKELRRGRGLAVNAGAIGITLATAIDAGERAEMARYLSDFISRFCGAVGSIKRSPLLGQLDPENLRALEEIKGFGGEIEKLDPKDHFSALTRDRATELTTRAREMTLPSFYVLIRFFENERAKKTARRAAHVKEQTKQLEKMFSEVEDIGRMIHLISLNASVEAARAGGESGRSFKVIADEIRSLAAKSAALIETTRSALKDEETGL